jgi:hypothetical protein
LERNIDGSLALTPSSNPTHSTCSPRGRDPKEEEKRERRKRRKRRKRNNNFKELDSFYFKESIYMIEWAM